MNKEKKNYKLVERQEVNNTPFIAVKLKDTNWILTMGAYKMTLEQFSTFEEVETYVQSHMWDIIITMVTIVTEKTVEELTKQKAN